jgi:hypothetical protein
MSSKGPDGGLWVVTASEPHPDLLPLLTSQGLHPEVVVTEGLNGYYDFFRERWREGKGFVLVEGDVLPWPGAIQQLLACPRDWCAHAYRLDSGYVPAFGLVKFTSMLVKRTQGFLERIEDRSWKALDSRIRWELIDVTDTDHHHHLPPVIHTNPRYLSEPIEPPPVPIQAKELPEGRTRLKLPKFMRAQTWVLGTGGGEVAVEVGADCWVSTSDEKVIGALRALAVKREG